MSRLFCSARFARPAGWLIGLLLTTLRPPPTPAAFLWSFLRFRKPFSRGYVFVSMMFSYFSIGYLSYPRPAPFDRFFVPGGDIRLRDALDTTIIQPSVQFIALISSMLWTFHRSTHKYREKYLYTIKGFTNKVMLSIINDSQIFMIYTQ